MRQLPLLSKSCDPEASAHHLGMPCLVGRPIFLDLPFFLRQFQVKMSLECAIFKICMKSTVGGISGGVGVN